MDGEKEIPQDGDPQAKRTPDELGWGWGELITVMHNIFSFFQQVLPTTAKGEGAGDRWGKAEAGL